jgi:SAM-dependent methyltransferase
MYVGRRKMHEEAIAWVEARGADKSVMDLGCGVGEGYCDAFAGRAYVGVDIAAGSIDWARTHRANPRHRYEARDFIADPFVDAADIVMSSGTIDNAYDPEAYLDAMISAAREWIYLTCYRGWFAEHDEHAFSYNPQHGCFYADLSARRLREHLESRGCRDIVVEPRATGRTDIPFETRVTARVPGGAA